MSMWHSFYNSMATSRVINATAAGTTTINSTAVDTTGYDAVAFLVGFGTLTATQVTSIKVQHSDDNSTFADVAGTASAALADADGTKMLGTEVYKPTKRYVRVTVVRGTANAVIDFGVAFMFRADTVPAAYGATWAAAPEVFNSPQSGTA